MTFEQTFFLKCMGDYCNHINKEYSLNNLDMDALFKIAKEQSLGGILYSQIQKDIGHEVGENAYQKNLIQDVFFSINRKYLLQEICEEFEKNQISFICFKGSVLRNYYPTPELRSMGDIDILIHPEDREKSDSIMVDILGYKKYVDNHDVWTYNIREFEIEVHTHMFYEEMPNHYDYRTYFDSIWNHCENKEVFGLKYPNMYIPEEPFHFLYLIAHVAKHILNKGIGFRAYLDLVFLTKRIDEKKWCYIVDELEKIHLLDFSRNVLSLCENWFSVKMPINSEKIDDLFYEEVITKTFKDGTFGLSNTQNKGADPAKVILSENKNYWISIIKYIIRKLFPPYRDMQLIPWYSFIDGKPWLMPIAWIYRWLYCIIHKFEYGMDILLEPVYEKKKVINRESYIHKWKL